MKTHQNRFASLAETVIYPFLLLVIMWIVYVSELVFDWNWVTYGVRPQDYSSWRGIFFMPFLHSDNDFSHIVNNSFPIAIFLASTIYFYRTIALKIILISWLGTGAALLFLAPESNSFHVGMSGVIYALFGFLFISGFLRDYRPLQALTLGVGIFYGSMIWGIFPTKTHVSWEGHAAGFIIGTGLAFLFRKQGPQRQKLQYEVEKELGIEPLDLEAIYEEKVAFHEAFLAQQKAEQEKLEQLKESAVDFFYHYVPREKPTPPDENFPSKHTFQRSIKPNRPPTPPNEGNRRSEDE